MIFSPTLNPSQIVALWRIFYHKALPGENSRLAGGWKLIDNELRRQKLKSLLRNGCRSKLWGKLWASFAPVVGERSFHAVNAQQTPELARKHGLGAQACVGARICSNFP